MGERIVHILGLDLSLTGTGYYRVMGGHETHGAIETKGLKGVERLVFIESQIWDVITADGYIDQDWPGPPKVFLEGYAYARPNQAHQIGELGGVVRRLLHINGIPYTEIAPAAVKKFATGKGNADKYKVMSAVAKHWDKHFDSTDECDAFVLARIGMSLLSPGGDLTQYQQEVVEKIREGM